MATSIIKLHTLSGSGGKGSPCCILQIDEFYCLLDCGWTDDLHGEYILEISKWAKHIDAVLLSHQSIRHLGLLPYLVSSCGLRCPVYSTTPVYKMGQLALYDFYQSRYASEQFATFSLDDIDAAFSLVIQVKYQQTINLSGRGRGLCITPLQSGHTIGGTIWKLVKEDTDIIYAVDFNHKKERHLNAAVFDACMRPHLLILDASNALYSHPRRKDRDENLKQCILKSLRRGGNVLVCADTSGRILEIAHFLEQCWLNQESGMMAYGLAMLNYVAFNVVDFAKSMVEWMSEKVMRTFEEQRSNPFHFRHMQLCHTLEQLDAVPEPKVVLASASDLSHGFSRQLFAEWADNDLNTVIVTSRESDMSAPETAGHPDYSNLLERLIGLSKGDPEARAGLPTSTTGTLVLPMKLHQRVSAAQLVDLENEMPRIKNAVQPLPDLNLGDTPVGLEPSSSLTEADINMDSLDDGPATGDTPAPIGGDFVSPESANNTAISTLRIRPATQEESTLLEKTSPHPATARIQQALTDEYARLPGEGESDEHRFSNTCSVPALTTSPALPAPAHVGDCLVGAAPLICVGGAQLTVGRHQPGYDIYPGIQNHAGGQFFRTAKRTQLLFPQVDKKIHWDEYGGKLDPDLFSQSDSQALSTSVDHGRKGSKSNVSLPGFESKSLVNVIQGSLLDHLASHARQFGDPETKTKCIAYDLEIPLRCELKFLDYEGRSDGEAIQRIVVGLRPQEMILLGNNQAGIDHLAQYCRTVHLLSPGLIHTPDVCQVVNCTKEGDIYQARMKDSLVSSLKFTKIRDYELAWVEATITLDADEMEHSVNLEGDDTRDACASGDVDMRRDEETENAVVKPKQQRLMLSNKLPVLSLPTDGIGAHKTVFVNEPKLSDNAIEDVRQLNQRIRAREALADELCQKIHSVQAQLLSMRQYQEEILSFEELVSKLGNRPKSPLILCLAAENKQMQQLKVENHALVNSLEEHRAVLDIIMAKYREQVSHLLYTNKIEGMVRLESHRKSPRNRMPSTNRKMATLANIAKDVSDKGDAYAVELEKELFRLRAENAGLRELLDISNAFSIQSTTEDTSTNDTGGRFVSHQNSSVGLENNQQHPEVNIGIPNPPSTSSHQPPAFMSARKRREEGQKDDYDNVYSLLLYNQSGGPDKGSSRDEDEEASRDSADDDEDAVTVTNNSLDDEDPDMFESANPYMRSFTSLG